MPVASIRNAAPGCGRSIRFLLLFDYPAGPIHCAWSLFYYCRFTFYAPTSIRMPLTITLGSYQAAT
jgi:hypothetical protein